MSKTLYPLFIIVLIAAAITCISSFYIVDETNQVVITQFGEPIGQAVKAPGMHFKMPFIQQAHYFEKRLLEWDGDPNRIPTEDKKYIWIDTTARWRIVDPLLFLQTVHDERGAHTRLDDLLDGAARNVIPKHKLIEIVRDSNHVLTIDTSEQDKIMGREFEKIDDDSGREVVTREMLDGPARKSRSMGLTLLIYALNALIMIRRSAIRYLNA